MLRDLTAWVSTRFLFPRMSGSPLDVTRAVNDSFLLSQIKMLIISTGNPGGLPVKCKSDTPTRTKSEAIGHGSAIGHREIEFSIADGVAHQHRQIDLMATCKVVCIRERMTSETAQASQVKARGTAAH
jgi:hypothetical protein